MTEVCVSGHWFFYLLNQETPETKVHLQPRKHHINRLYEWSGLTQAEEGAAEEQGPDGFSSRGSKSCEDPEDPEEERVSQKLCSLTCCDLHGLKTETPADNVHTHTHRVFVGSDSSQGVTEFRGMCVSKVIL